MLSAIRMRRVEKFSALIRFFPHFTSEMTGLLVTYHILQRVDSNIFLISYLILLVQSKQFKLNSVVTGVLKSFAVEYEFGLFCSCNSMYLVICIQRTNKLRASHEKSSH